jgi:hypothetical protein
MQQTVFMHAQTPLPLTLGFSVLAAGVAGLAAWGIALATGPVSAGAASRRAPRLLAVAALWMAAWALLARSGVLLDVARRPPPMMFMLAASVAAGVALGASPLGGRLARRLPLVALVAFQVFRLPLELIMGRAARAGLMPVQMSFEGWNFDIVTGASALLVAALLATDRAPRWLVVAWNAVGIVLLAVIFAIAVASTPLVHAFGTSPAVINTWVGTAPFVWLPTVFVACALAGHIVVTRRLLFDARTR